MNFTCTKPFEQGVDNKYLNPAKMWPRKVGVPQLLQLAQCSLDTEINLNYKNQNRVYANIFEIMVSLNFFDEDDSTNLWKQHKMPSNHMGISYRSW